MSNLQKVWLAKWLAEPWAPWQGSETEEPEIAQQGVVEIAVGDISVGFMVIL